MKAFIKMQNNQVGVLEGDVMARYLLKPREERAEELSFTIAKAYAKGCSEATKGNLEEIDSPLMFQAIRKAREIIQEYQRPLAEKKQELLQENKELEYKIYMIENYRKAHELSQELNKLGLFHGAEKKELKAQIEALRKPIEVPKEYQEKIELNKSMIEEYDEILHEYDNLSKGCTWAEDELYRKGKNYKPTEKPQTAQKSQKEEKATVTKPTEKPSFKDQMKPLRSIK